MNQLSFSLKKTNNQFTMKSCHYAKSKNCLSIFLALDSCKCFPNALCCADNEPVNQLGPADGAHDDDSIHCSNFGNQLLLPLAPAAEISPQVNVSSIM